jgi:hypothetical protein
MERLEKQVLRPAAGDKGDVAAIVAVTAEPGASTSARKTN